MESDLDSRYEQLLEEYCYYFKEDPLAGDRGKCWRNRAAHWFARRPFNTSTESHSLKADVDVTIKLVNEAGEATLFKVKSSTLFLKLFAAYSQIKGLSCGSLRFRFDGRVVCNDDTPWKLGMKDGDVVDVILGQVGDIGHFDVRINSPGSQYLTMMKRSECSEESLLRYAQVVATLGGSPYATFVVQTLPCITPADLTPLRCFLDKQYEGEITLSAGVANKAHASCEDLKVYLKLNELLGYLSSEIVDALTTLFADFYDEIILRRCCAYGKFISFHTDYSLKTMQVALNDEDEYGGGRLTFLTSNRGLECPHRAAGTITIHGNDIVHGVSELTSGVRYGLFFIKKKT